MVLLFFLSFLLMLFQVKSYRKSCINSPISFRIFCTVADSSLFIAFISAAFIASGYRGLHTHISGIKSHDYVIKYVLSSLFSTLTIFKKL